MSKRGRFVGQTGNVALCFFCTLLATISKNAWKCNYTPKEEEVALGVSS